MSGSKEEKNYALPNLMKKLLNHENVNIITLIHDMTDVRVFKTSLGFLLHPSSQHPPDATTSLDRQRSGMHSKSVCILCEKWANNSATLLQYSLSISCKDSSQQRYHAVTKSIKESLETQVINNVKSNDLTHCYIQSVIFSGL